MKKGLLEFGVLACLSREESYGYQIIRDLSEWIEISESTLYPILRRLEGNKDVEMLGPDSRMEVRLAEMGKVWKEHPCVWISRNLPLGCGV